VADLPALTVVLLNSLIWFVLYIAAGFINVRIPLARFNPNGWLFRPRRWEKGGAFYDRTLHLKAWKGLLPDGAALFRRGFRKKRMRSRDHEYCRKFVLETCRAESLHWTVLAAAPLFFLWNEWRVAVLMIPFAVLVNLPCVVTQRFNRPRLSRLQERGDSRQPQTGGEGAGRIREQGHRRPSTGVSR